MAPFRALPPVDRRLAQELVFGVTRWRLTLDWLIARATDGRPQRPVVQVLLRVALYQMFWLDRVPAHAAVDCAVELARLLGVPAQAGFINAVLRECGRHAREVQRDLDTLCERDPAVGWSHPAWLVERWRLRWPENWRQLLKWNNQPPPTYARANTLRMDPGKLLEAWREEGVRYEFFQRDWTGENLVFELLDHPPLATLPSFRAGGFYVQDPSTLLAVRELEARPDETLLDYCAAPGGKTTYLAQRIRNTGCIVAHDDSEERLALLRENCQRLGVQNCQATLHDPIGRQFDRVLVDAPCSNTGVLRRRLEARWRIHPAELQRLSATQRSLLDRTALFVRPGGVLVYSTCSLEPEENGEVVRAFLTAHPEFQLDRERELVPFRDGVDGAYVARLVHGAAP